MKTVTVILVALTVFTLFLESSAAPAEQNAISKEDNAITKIGATVGVTDEDKQAIYERMELSEAALPHAKDIAADAIREATGKQKLTLEAVYNWLVDLIPTAGSIHEEIRAAIASGSVSDIKAVRVQINAAVAGIKANLDGFNKELAPGEVTDGINKNVNNVMANAAFCSENLKTYV